MAIGVIGRKIGMTRIFTEDQASVPVTVIEVQPNRITQVKTQDKDGYQAIQVTTGERRATRVSKSMAGHYAKAGVEAGRGLWEFTIDDGDSYEVKQELGVDLFEAGQKIDVSGTSIGKGYAGTVKRHGFHMGDATHGNSLAHRVPGSIGQNQTPGRVFKGKKMSGHMGNVRRTVQSLEVVRVDKERNIILVKGSVPGSKGGDLILRHAVKVKAPEKAAKE